MRLFTLLTIRLHELIQLLTFLTKENGREQYSRLKGKHETSKSE